MSLVHQCDRGKCRAVCGEPATEYALTIKKGDKVLAQAAGELCDPCTEQVIKQLIQVLLLLPKPKPAKRKRTRAKAKAKARAPEPPKPTKPAPRKKEPKFVPGQAVPPPAPVIPK